jgi:acyl dehydratase
MTTAPRPQGSPLPDLGAVGFVSEQSTVSWTSDDTLLYALAVGAGTSQLHLTTENTEGVRQRALPSYAALVGRIDDSVRRAVGPAWDPIRLVYAEQGLTWHRELPPSGSAVLTSRVTEILDKGSGALVTVDIDALDSSGTPLFTATRRVFLRGAGGFGGPSPAAPDARDATPSGPVIAEHHVLPANQALLYRLTGDRHRLHSDPAFARRAGFDRPILHGLCTYGVVARLLLGARCGDDPARMRSLELRFRSPVWPGDELELRHWSLGNHRVGFRVVRAGTDAVLVDDGVLVADPRSSSKGSS